MGDPQTVRSQLLIDVEGARGACVGSVTIAAESDALATLLSKPYLLANDAAFEVLNGFTPTSVISAKLREHAGTLARRRAVSGQSLEVYVSRILDRCATDVENLMRHRVDRSALGMRLGAILEELGALALHGLLELEKRQRRTALQEGELPALPPAGHE